MFERPRSGERALLVRVGFGGPVEREDLEEFSQLATSAGATVVGTVTGRRERPDPRLFVGSGKAEEVRQAAVEQCAEVVLIDHALSPSQERNLEKLIGLRVLDRNALILDIFAQRARSHEGKLEVELAQLKHIASRLVRGWTHLERQRGGGIGNRGPGETQLETDRRLLGERVRVLTKRLEKLQQQRETGRARRVEIPIPSVALVGYTNAGKSTLFRALSGADTYIADQLFATLDPLVRRVQLPGGTPVVIADTVGFIRELPHELVAAFQSTLTEAREATLLLHVVDASDPRRDEHIEEVNRVLDVVGASEIPQIRVYNKIDRIETLPHVERDAEGRIVQVWVSAQKGLGLDELRGAIAERLARFARSARIRIPAAAGALRARLHQAGTVRDETYGDDGSIELGVTLPDTELLVLARTPGVQILTAGMARKLVPLRIATYNSKFHCAPAEAQQTPHTWRDTAMAWNEPGGNKNPWGKRPGQDGQNVDEAFKNFQRKLENLLKGGPSGGGPAGGGAADSPSGNSMLVLIGALLVIGWVYMSTFQIGAAERGVIQRFGKQIDVREPGLGWHWWPLERVTKVNVSEVRSLEYKSRVLTADINLIEMSLVIQYQLRDPVKFLFQIREPEQTLREVAESAIREVVGRSDLDSIIVGNRQQITTRTRDLIQRTMEQYNGGITVSTVNLTDIQVPEAVVPAQRDANKALADKERFVKEAEAYASGILPVAEGQASRQIQEAEGYKAQVVAIADGEASRFTQLQGAYANSPRVTRERLYIETVESVLSKSRKVVVDTKNGNNQMLYLPLDKLIERTPRDTADATVTATRPVPLEPESSATSDPRARGER